MAASLMAVVELRGSCGHLVGKLDPEQGIVQTACRRCSYDARRLVVHWFATEDGTPLETIKPLQGELGDEGVEPTRGAVD
jgi:hypothetical protein